jgi:hypothetical protein
MGIIAMPHLSEAFHWPILNQAINLNCLTSIHGVPKTSSLLTRWFKQRWVNTQELQGGNTHGKCEMRNI